MCTYFEPALLELSELTADAARLMIFPALLRICSSIWDAPLPLLRLGACGTVGSSTLLETPEGPATGLARMSPVDR